MPSLPQVIPSQPDPPLFANLESGVDYMVSHPILDAVSMVAHQGLHILRCVVCQSYLTSGTMGHMDKHSFSIPAPAISAAMEFCQSNGIFSTQKEVLLPRPMGPPVQGLPLVLGYTCRCVGCTYAVVDSHTMRGHERDIHKLQPYKGDTRQRYHLQGLFSNPVRYFRVNASLSVCDAPAIIEALAVDFIPTALASEAILTASDDRGRTPLDKYLQLDDLLLDIRHSRPHLASLASLKQAPQEPEAGGMYARLAVTVKDWHKTLAQRMKGHPAKYDLERIIIYGPQTIPISR